MLRTHDEIINASDGDAFARWDIDPAHGLTGAARGGAVAWTVEREHYEYRPWLNAIGPPDAVVPLVDDLLNGRLGALDVEPAGITVPHGVIPLLPVDLRPPEYGAWVWWWTDQVPPRRQGEQRAQLLDLDAPSARPSDAPVVQSAARTPRHSVDTVRDELVALLAVANPTASTQPGDASVRSWMGIRDAEGRLVACAADRPSVPAIPHLASIATHPDARGQGLGAAITAAMTRFGLTTRGAQAVTLGMYASNDVGRALYTRLGFHPQHHFTSGTLPRSG